MEPLTYISFGAAVFVGMEPVAALMHRYVMHGALWSLHKSHHSPRHGSFESNDLFAVAFAVPTVALFAFSGVAPVLFPIACGISAYGIAYVLLHDAVVHRRIPFLHPPRQGYVARLVAAHHLHHAVRTRDGAVSFGFLYAPPLAALRRRLRSNNRAIVTPPARRSG